jgi:hypothetical protein
MIFWRTLTRWLTSILYVGSAILAFVAFGENWFGTTTYEGAFAVTVLGLLVIAGVIGFGWQEYRFSRKARYAEALPNLAECAGRIAYAASTPERCELVMKDAVREVSEAFTLITGTRVGVCLKKVIYNQSQNRCKVEDVCRDPKSENRTVRIRKSLSGQVIDHWVDMNTAFKRTWTQEGRPQGAQYFLSNDLSSEPQYQNTSFEAYGEPSGARFAWLRRVKWTLPYISTLVLPVLGPLRNGEQTVLGYLAIDSASRHVFDARYDVSFLRIIGDFLSPALDAHMRHELGAQNHIAHEDV